MNTNKEIAALNFRLDALLSQVELQHTVILQLQEGNGHLKKEVARLTERLQRYEHPKNSNNSSVPPSQDENRPLRKSLRERSGKQPGGQKGRIGKTLRQIDNPDFIENCVSN